MKFILTLFSFFCLCIACKTENVRNSSDNKAEYPEELVRVFTAHGGYDTWNEMKAMIYTIKNDDGDEKQSIDLEDRRERIEGIDYTMGFDGKQYWIDADTSIKKNPVFYTNLMLYFYAMPFILGDDGINYSATSPLEFEGRSYPGFRISYDNSIGVSPEDEYFIHYDPESYQMTWLGYTVTYFSKAKSDKIRWIRYDDWMQLNGLTLPSSLAWYKNENNLPKTERNRVNFDKIILSKNKLKDNLFTPTKNARIISE